MPGLLSFVVSYLFAGGLLLFVILYVVFYDVVLCLTSFLMFSPVKDWHDDDPEDEWTDVRVKRLIHHMYHLCSIAHLVYTPYSHLLSNPL